MALAAAVMDGRGKSARATRDRTLRTNQISAVSPRYARTDSGGSRQREAVDDEGTVWTWLLGTFAPAGSPSQVCPVLPAPTEPSSISDRLTQGTAKGKAT
jgi:hypothetical protein